MPLLSDIQAIPAAGRSGSAGAIVASHNQHGPYYRARTPPTGPLTFRKVLARTAFKHAVDLWLLLTQAQRDAWQAYAIAIATTHPSAPARLLTGRDQFIRSQSIRYRIFKVGPPWEGSDAPPTTAPPLLHVTSVLSLTASAKLRVYFDNTDEWATTLRGALILYASPPLTDTIRFHVSPMRMAAPIWGSPFPPPSSPQDVTYPYPATPTHQPVNVFFRATLKDGRLSRKYYNRAYVFVP